MITENNLPKYVKLRKSALKLTGNQYFRTGGNWGVEYEIVNGKLFSVEKNVNLKHLDGIELIEITEQEYKDDNKGHC